MNNKIVSLVVEEVLIVSLMLVLLNEHNDILSESAIVSSLLIMGGAILLSRIADMLIDIRFGNMIALKAAFIFVISSISIFIISEVNVWPISVHMLLVIGVLFTSCCMLCNNILDWTFNHLEEDGDVELLCAEETNDSINSIESNEVRKSIEVQLPKICYVSLVLLVSLGIVWGIILILDMSILSRLYCWMIWASVVILAGVIFILLWKLSRKGCSKSKGVLIVSILLITALLAVNTIVVPKAYTKLGYASLIAEEHITEAHAAEYDVSGTKVKVISYAGISDEYTIECLGNIPKDILKAYFDAGYEFIIDPVRLAEYSYENHKNYADNLTLYGCLVLDDTKEIVFNPGSLFDEKTIELLRKQAKEM